MPKPKPSTENQIPRVCGHCTHYEPDEPPAEDGYCYAGPPTAALDDEGALCALRPPVAATERACGLFVLRLQS